MSIAKVYELSCDSLTHEDSAEGMISLRHAANFDEARAVARLRGWECTTDGRTFCPLCLVKPSTQEPANAS